MPGSKELGEALRFLRRRRNLLQKELAAAANISKGMLSGYERGKTRPTLVTLGKLLTALEADLCDLYCAVEMVHGRPAAVHGLSPQFQPEEARPPKLALVKPPAAPSAPAAAASARPPGGAETAGVPSLPADVEQAMSDGLANLHTVLRYVLPRLGPQ
jgi:transcriptional regulator with XRE-family HTH domain